MIRKTRLVDLPRTETCRLIPFEIGAVRLQLRAHTPENRCILTVTGMRPCLNMRILLIPRVYALRPACWGIEVVGCVEGGYCLDDVGPFSESLDVTGVLGTEGVEVIGSAGTLRLTTPAAFGDTP